MRQSALSTESKNALSCHILLSDTLEQQRGQSRTSKDELHTDHTTLGPSVDP